MAAIALQHAIAQCLLTLPKLPAQVTSTPCLRSAESRAWSVHVCASVCPIKANGWGPTVSHGNAQCLRIQNSQLPAELPAGRALPGQVPHSQLAAHLLITVATRHLWFFAQQALIMARLALTVRATLVGFASRPILAPR